MNRGDDVDFKDEYSINIIETEEIKVECCEENIDSTPYNELNPPLMDDEASNEMVKRESPISNQLEFLNDDNSTVNISEERALTCNICGSKFHRKYHLLTHMQDMHSDSKKHQCQFCPKEFSSHRSLKRHEKIHNVKAPSCTCKVCGESFNQKVLLTRHLKAKGHNSAFKTIETNQKHEYIEAPTIKKVYPCVLCVPPIVFSSSSERDMHKNTIHSSFECDVCKNSFKSQETLNSHKSRHSDEPRPFVCTVSNVVCFVLISLSFYNPFM